MTCCLGFLHAAKDGKLQMPTTFLVSKKFQANIQSAIWIGGEKESKPVSSVCRYFSQLSMQNLEL